MRFLYDIFFALFAVAYLPYMILKGNIRRDFSQRLGFLPGDLNGAGKSVIWVHTVSVGEVLAAKTFVQRMSQAFPSMRIVVSTTTKTGHALAKNSFSPNTGLFYFPLDISFIVDRVIKFINPSVFIILETEIWPNMILGLKKKNVPVILINGRISDKSYGGYMKIRSMIALVLKSVDLYCMQTQADARRLEDMGAPPERIKVSGNMKYDSGNDTSVSAEQAAGYRTALGLSEFCDVLICGSTHKGEEDMILTAYKALLVDCRGLRLIVAPRHIDRVPDVEKIFQGQGYLTSRFSSLMDGKNRAQDNSVILVDTIGHLSRIYSIASAVYIGGSLIKKGGHNVSEAGRFGKPAVFGPYMNNFRDMAARFVESGAALVAHDQLELTSALRKILTDKDLALRMGNNAMNLVIENTGAVDRTVELVRSCMRE